MMGKLRRCPPDRERNPQAYQDVPILINNFNRLSCLENLVSWLQAGGYRNITVIDNDSTFPPLLSYYGSVRGSGLCVVRLRENVGPQALWLLDLLRARGITGAYVYTDSDVVPIRACPRNVVAHMQAMLAANPSVRKVGLGLRIDNLPAHYAHRDSVLLWERQFWRWPAVRGAMSAPVDTTFALYRAEAGHDLEDRNLRTTYPYLADHLGWHENSASPSTEDEYYRRTARADVTSWTGRTLRSDFAAGLPEVRTPRLVRLTAPRVAAGAEWPGWIEIDPSGNGLERVEDCSVDGFYTEEDFGHPRDRLTLLQVLHRCAKPNARFILRLPYRPDVASARSWLLAGQPAHAGLSSRYAGDWAISAIHLLPARIGGDPAEMLVHLFAVKPPRAPVASLEVWSEPRLEPTPLNPTPRFDVLP